VYNPFVSPIPSNLLIVKDDNFPVLSEVLVGVDNIYLVTLWLMWMTDREEREKIYA
jgi:hypothetical protein